MKRIRTYHDNFFQTMMEKAEVARSFFQAYMDEEIIQALDWSTFSIADAVRREPGKRSRYTDITYHVLTKAPQGSVFLHVEQERGIDKGMLERIFQYNVGLVLKHRNQGNNKLPLVINFVLYNGKKKDYPYFKDIYEYFERPDLARLVMGNPFTLINLNKKSDEVLATHGPGGVMEILLKRASQTNFSKWLQGHQSLMKRLPAGAYLNDGIDYALEVGQDKAEEIINSFILVYPQLKEMIMTAARQLERKGEKIGIQKGVQQGVQKGMQQGLQQGMQQGMQQEKLAIASNLLKKGCALSLIQEVTGLSLVDISSLDAK